MQFYKTRFWRKVFLKKNGFECKTFFEKRDFEWKNMCKKHDFEIKISRLVIFWIKKFSSSQILNQLFTTRQILKRNILPKSTTCTFHIPLLHITVYNYRLEYLRQLDNSLCHRSNNTSCTIFRKDLHFRFHYGVPLSSLKLIDVCENELLLMVIQF